MTRMFISLYLILLSGLFLIGWGSEQLWQALHKPNNQQQSQLEPSLRLLPLTLNQFSSESEVLTQLKDIFKSDIKILTFDDMLWSKSQVSQLTQGEFLLTYNQAGQRIVYVYWQNKHKIIELGPLELDKTQATDYLSLSLRVVSYLLLALVIALWVWPLWRDLKRLEQASVRYAKGEFDYNSNIKKTSNIYPIAMSFAAMAKQISQLIEEQTQLVNAVSHDLRTPISRIKFSLGLLPAETLDQLPDVQQDISELEKLIEALLSYARLEHQDNKLNLDYVDFNQLILHQVERFRAQTSKQIELVIESDLVWLADGYLIERCLTNLISNALRYAHTKIVLSAAIKQNKLIICVEDDGAGVDPSDYQTIFKPFARLETSRNKKSAGFGLGLAIVHKIGQWHSGNCQVSRSPLGGACFELVIPDLDNQSPQN